MVPLGRIKFPLILRMCRENAGLTQKQVADALNIERSTYAYYESGVSHPNGNIILKLSNLFNVDPNVLVEAIGNYDPFKKDNSTVLKVSDSSTEERDIFTALSHEEQTILLMYRSFSEEQKRIVRETLLKFQNENAKAFLKKDPENQSN